MPEVEERNKNQYAGEMFPESREALRGPHLPLDISRDLSSKAKEQVHCQYCRRGIKYTLYIKTPIFSK